MTEQYLQDAADRLNDYAIRALDSYSYVSHNNFYLTAKPLYRNYYTNTLLKISQWLDGRVQGFHDTNEGIFSTKLATSLVKGIGNQICGRRVVIKTNGVDEAGQALKQMNDWQLVGNFQKAVRSAIKFAAGLGTSALKINVAANGEPWLEPLRFDQFHFSTDSRGELIEISANLRRLSSLNLREREVDYYLVEKRFFVTSSVTTPRKIGDAPDSPWVMQFLEDRKPYVIYEVHRTTNVGPDVTAQPASEKVRFDSLPSSIRSTLKQNYRALRLDEPMLLPFENLGVELLQFDEDLAIPGLPFGSSVLQDNISYLMAYDLAWSYFVRDMHQGRGTLLLPENFIKNTNQSSSSALSKAMPSTAIRIPSLNPDDQKPDKIQFELRGAEWEQILNLILKKIATNIGMSPKTIAAYLTEGAVQKTATEIDAEDDATIAYIDIHRSEFEGPLNRLINTVGKYLGLSVTFAISFGISSLVNKDRVIDREIKKLDAGLTTKEDAIREINPEDDEQRIQERLSKIKAEEEKQLANSSPADPLDAFSA